MDAKGVHAEPLPLFRALEEIAIADTPEAVVAIVRSHLMGWTPERIHRLQLIDGGWGPFDVAQQPIWIDGVDDLRFIQESFSGHRCALQAAHVTVTPELIELDEFLFVASRMAETLASSPRWSSARTGKAIGLSAFL